MKSRMDLSRSCQSERWAQWTGANGSPPPLILAPESALGSRPRVALSSAQVEPTIHGYVPENTALTKENGLSRS